MFRIVIVRDSEPNGRRHRRRRGAGTAVVIAGIAFALAGLTSATAQVTGESPAIDINRNLNPAKSVSTGATIYNLKPYTFVARGGSSTVPTTATAVRIVLTDNSGKPGLVDVYPLGRPEDAVTVSWSNGQGVNSLSTAVGMSDKVEIMNRSGRQISLGIKIVAFSDVIPVGQISARGGNPGDVLRTEGLGRVFWGPETTRLTIRSETRTDTTNYAGSKRFNGSAACTSREFPVAGGYSISDDSPSATLRASEAYNNNWIVAIDFSTSSVPRTVTTYVTCALK